MAEDPQEIVSIPDIDAQEQQTIPFEGDELIAARSGTGDIYIAISGMCQALGLTTQAQIRRIQRTTSLAKGLRRLPLATTRGVRSTPCLRIDRVALWIAGIETDRIKPEFRPKIEAYQDELAPIAMRVFTHAMGITNTPATDPRVAALTEQYDLLMAAATFISEHTESLATMPEQLAQAVTLLESLAAQQEAMTTAVERLAQEQQISPAQQRKIQEAVDRIVEDSNGHLTHTGIYGMLKSKLHVGSYSQIPATRYEEVMAFLRDLWKRSITSTSPEQKSLF
jgi:hypothetical protein